MSDRIQWGISFTAGLFAVSAFIISIIVVGRPTAGATGILLLVLAGIAGTGIVFSWTTRGGVKAAQGQFSYLRDEYLQRESAFKEMGFPRPFGDPKDHYSGNFSARVFPIVMLVCWISDLVITWTLAMLIFGASGRDILYTLWPALAAAAV